MTLDKKKDLFLYVSAIKQSLCYCKLDQISFRSSVIRSNVVGSTVIRSTVVASGLQIKNTVSIK